MILLDNKADTLPCGLIGTPFETVYKALRTVAADVWAVDPTVYRAGMAWGWYALHRPEKLAGFRDVVAAALVSSFAPLVKDTQTDAELVEYLRQWRDYTPTFGRLQALYALFGATVDIQPITDPESQAVLPVTDTRLAFYVRITEVDFSRPLSLDDAREIALRATPLGSRPYVYYALESRTQIPVAAIPQAPELFVENWEIAQPAAPPVPLGDFILVDALGNVVYSVENLTEIEFTPTGYFTIDEGNEVIFVEQSPFPVVCIDEGTRTPESVAPDDSFDTELPYYDTKLYIVTTDDGQDETLYGWEAEEGTPVVALPTVTEAGYVSIYPNHSNFYPDVVNEGRVWDYSSSQWVESSYDSTKTYAAVDWSAENSQSGFYGIRISEYNGHLGLKNVLSKIIVGYIESKYAVCDSASASVVAVYGNGVIYNAFKYTANNTDYYYVLDGTQTDWTDNLSGLGYVLYTGEIEILLGFKWNDAGTELVSVNDLSNDYYWARVISQADRDLLSAMGIASNIESYLKYGGLLYNSYYTYSFVAIYSDMGETVAPLHDPSNCLIRSYSSGARVVIGLYYDGTSSEAVMAWKCRITRNL